MSENVEVDRLATARLQEMLGKLIIENTTLRAQLEILVKTIQEERKNGAAT